MFVLLLSGTARGVPTDTYDWAYIIFLSKF